MRPPLFSLSTLAHWANASVSGEPIASEWPMRQMNFCCARATTGAPMTPAAAKPAAPLSSVRRPIVDLFM